jgi:asparagine synthase (glutamine-hydrolysing)
MAPPAHTDPQKWAAMRALAEEYLSDRAIADAGLLDAEGVKALFALHDNPELTSATQNKLDAVINHMLGVQVLHRHFVAADVPLQARQKARELGWSAT